MQTRDITIRLRVGARDDTTLAEIITGVQEAVADIRERQADTTRWWAIDAEANWTYVGDGLLAEQESARDAAARVAEGSTR